jgi:hypothetical protein
MVTRWLRRSQARDVAGGSRRKCFWWIDEHGQRASESSSCSVIEWRPPWQQGASVRSRPLFHESALFLSSRAVASA